MASEASMHLSNDDKCVLFANKACLSKTVIIIIIDPPFLRYVDDAVATEDDFRVVRPTDVAVVFLLLCG